jgi:hypothetical protein
MRLPLMHRVAAVAIPLLLLLSSAPPARAQSADQTPRTIKQLQRAQLRARRLVRAHRSEAGEALPSAGASRMGLDREKPFSIEALGSNVRANNRAIDVLPGSTQSEESIAAWGQYVLVAWNDAETSAGAPPNNDIQGYGFSTNGGVSFTDGGVPPKKPNWTWISDPIVTVNEKTGTFYYCALVDSTPSFSGIGIVPATFSGPNLVWGTPVMIRKVSTSLLLLDKPWAVADSASDSVYVSYTTFTAFGYDHIQFQRSSNGTGWTPAVTLSAGADSGYVQGSRPAVGPNGEVYVVWAAVGPIDVDFFRIRKSTNAGGTFAAQVTMPGGGNPPSGYYGNWGSGAPGYNREQGVTFPSIAVDRSGGPRRGRVYVAWNESINFYDDGVNSGIGPGAKSEPPGESGANDTPGTATPFTVNNTLRGTMGSGTDFDYWSFSATQGQTGVFFMDSVGINLDPAFRLFCTDGTTRLGYSNFGVGGVALIVFTFPNAGTYYLRCAGFSGTTGNYRIRTKFNVPGPERARDHRDVFVTSSDNGTAWSVPVRVNDDPGRFDNWLPEVAVGGQGLPYVMWYDWHDAAPSRCGGTSHVYLTLSQTGGSSWLPSGPVTNVASDWTNSTSYLAPNQGDYTSLYVNGTAAYLAWADVRDGDPDVYTLAVPLLVTPVAASLVSAVALRDRVTLTWYASEAEGFTAAVYRRTDGTDWAVLDRLDVPANGRIVYVDSDVAPGASYQYRVGIVENGAEKFFGDASVAVPRFDLEIASVAPNPAYRDLWVAFTLPVAAPATLRLIDVAGREVRRHAVGATAGPQRVNLAEGSVLPMGVYAVQLTQGARTVTARVSVVR